MSILIEQDEQVRGTHRAFSAEAQVSPEAIPVYDAWYFAQALAGQSQALTDQSLERLSQRVSPNFRVIAQQLAQMPPAERGSAWEHHTSSLAESETQAITLAIAAVNPADPAPEDQSWGHPLAFKLPPVEPFPLEVLPPPVGRLIRQSAQAINCPPDFPAVAALVVAGAAIGRSASLRLKDGYFASASLYGICIGQPGDGKSPAVSHVTSPMFRIDEDLVEKWKSEKEAYDVLEAEYEEKNRPARKTRQKGEPVDGDKASDMEGNRTNSSKTTDTGTLVKPTPPTLRRNVICDGTIEAIDALMEQNPRGILQVLDEASTLTSSMNQYRGGKGSDRQWYMSTWSNQARIVDRKGNADLVPIRVPHPFLGLIGGMVPDMLGSLCDDQGRHEGFLDRILFTYPDPVPKIGWREDGVEKEVAAEWSEILTRLQGRPLLIENLRTHPYTVQFTTDGKRAWAQMIDAHEAEQSSPDFPQSLSGPWSKLAQYAGRLALILHVLALASDPTSDDSRIPDVTAETVRAVEKLLAYFKSHTRRVYEAMKARARGDEGNDDVQSILKWIYRHSPESFSTRQLTRDLSQTFSKRAHAFKEALDWLVDKGCIRLQGGSDDPKSRGRGRPKARVYLVNPYLLGTQNRQNPSSGSLTDPHGDFVDSATDLVVERGKETGDGKPVF